MTNQVEHEILKEIQAIRKLLEEIDKSLSSIAIKSSHQIVPDRMNTFDRQRAFF